MKRQKNHPFVSGVLDFLSPFLTLALVIGVIMAFLDFYPKLTAANPPRPEIEKAEFPFALEYTIGDTPTTIEGTMICKFNGFHYNSYEGVKKRKWLSYYEGVSEGLIILLKQDDVLKIYKDSAWIETEEPCNMRIYLSPALPSYFMGDAEEDSYHDPSVYYEVYNADGYRIVWEGIYGSDIFDSPILAAYGIKITRWEIADPIENTFS